MRYNVPLVPQTTSMSCWAAGIAMIVGWAQRQSISPAQIAATAGYQQAYQIGLNPNDTKALKAWGLRTRAPQSYSVGGFADLVTAFGPLWVASAVPGPHIRVVTGFDLGKDAASSRVYINDPWQKGMTQFVQGNTGSRYTLTYQQFVTQKETLAIGEMNQPQPIYTAHLPSKPHNN